MKKILLVLILLSTTLSMDAWRRRGWGWGPSRGEYWGGVAVGTVGDIVSTAIIADAMNKPTTIVNPVYITVSNQSPHKVVVKYFNMSSKERSKDIRSGSSAMITSASQQIMLFKNINGRLVQLFDDDIIKQNGTIIVQ